jgi:DNA-binding transcriptional ArsR family regulator
LARKKKIDLTRLHQNSDQAAQLLKTVGNPHRLMILCTLADTEMSVGELNDNIDISQSPLSQHLAVLRRTGLVQTRREAQTIFYSLNGNEVRKLMDCLYDIYCS